MTFVNDWVVPVGSAVGAILVFIVLGWAVYVILKAAGVLRFFSWLKIRLFKHKKLLADEEIVEYCTQAVVSGKSEGDFMAELLLSNEYKKSERKDLMYVFRLIKKEIKDLKL